MEGLRRSSRSTKGQNSRLARELEQEREAAEPFSNGVRKRKLGEGQDDDGVRCICSGEGEGKMVECENCRTWQHITCMFGKDDEAVVPEVYWCSDCKRAKSEGAQDVSDTSIKGPSPETTREPSGAAQEDSPSIAQEELPEEKLSSAVKRPSVAEEELASPAQDKRPSVAGEELASPVQEDAAGINSGDESSNNEPEEESAEEKKLSDLEDKVRHSVANALYGILLKKAVPEALAAGKLELGDKTGEQFAEALAMEIEGALYEHMATRDPAPKKKKAKTGSDVGQKYRDKFRSLSFNLKDEKNPDLRLRIVTGQLTPEKIVTLSSEEMLNPELQKYACEVRKESIRDSVLKAEDMPRIRKTHKGDEIMDEYEDENDHGEQARETSRNLSDGEDDSHHESANSAGASDNDEGSNSDERGASSEQAKKKRILMNANVYNTSTADDFTYSPPASPGAYDYDEDKDTKNERSVSSSNNEVHDDDDDDDELERIIHGERINKANEQEDQEEEEDDDDDYDPELGFAAAPTKPDRSASGIMDPGNTFWNGHVSFVGMSEFPGTARHLHCTSANLTVRNWDAVMNVNEPIVIDGRLDQAKAESYLRQISRTKDLAAYLLTSDEPVPKANFDVLFEYFHSRHKFGVIKNRLRNIRDAYILTIGPNDRVPDYLRLPEKIHDEVVSRIMDGEKLVLGLLVVNQPIPQARPQPQAQQADLSNLGFSSNEIGTLTSFLAQNPEAANSPQALLNLLQRNS
ncbi:hypothetical protein TRVA0_031S01398 [Trichomonascus vanleenenianus]|uniref:Bye1p n=1 Tax=Trichomonascus vanleenenianus TaxID=2268995 RepID=UPI003ECA245D